MRYAHQHGVLCARSELRFLTLPSKTVTAARNPPREKGRRKNRSIWCKPNARNRRLALYPYEIDKKIS